MAVTKECRGHGVGKEMMSAVMDYITEETQAIEIQLDAQLTAIKFYETLGFIAYGDVFKDAGIDHMAMKYIIKR